MLKFLPAGVRCTERTWQRKSSKAGIDDSNRRGRLESAAPVDPFSEGEKIGLLLLYKYSLSRAQGPKVVRRCQMPRPLLILIEIGGIY